MNDKIRFTQITSADYDLTKRYTKEGAEIVSSAIAHMTSGYAKVIEIGDVTQLLGLLPTLQSTQAITCGVPAIGDTALTTRAGAEFRPDAVARTNEAFRFPDTPALFPIDVDLDGSQYRTTGEVLDALEACHPWLKLALRIARPSSSSFVGERGLRGVHVYFAVTSGADIPGLAKRMQIEQWLAGRGYVDISKSGALLVRQLSDALVYQPSRLMFEASPVLGEGITRDVPAGQICEPRPPATYTQGHPSAARAANGMLNARGLPPIKAIDERRFETMKRDAKNSRRREAKKKAIDYQTRNAIASGGDAEMGERYGLLAARALGDKALPAKWTIALRGGVRVTVGEILASLDAYLGQHCADPFDTWRPDLEPKHFGKAEIVMMYDRPGIWSHKLQEFFKLTDERAADLTSPLDMAAEKLCGLVEYPEPVGKKTAPLVNITHGVSLLLREIGCKPSFNASTYALDLDDAPEVGDLLGALSRIGCNNVTKRPIEDALEAVARRNRSDPWKDAALALPQWDKTPRLDTFFSDFAGAPSDEATRLTGCLLFAGIIMRQLRPGAPCPVVPVLIGKGGTGKSRFVQQLAEVLGFPPPPAISFSDDIRMTMAASVSAIAELGEMSGMAKRDMDDVKMWTTECQDVYRGPYERRAESHPRRFVLIGTANKHELNRDETGNRRFMPIFIEGKFSTGWRTEAPQLFAEAKARFCADEGAYRALVEQAADAVLTYNDAAMRRGEGNPASELDDILPEIVARLARTGDRGRFKLVDVMDAVRARLQQRTPTDRVVAAALKRRGCAPKTISGRNFYTVPAEVIVDWGMVDNDAQPAQARAAFEAAQRPQPPLH
ncbi:VapE domain-containing protein [Burkholderia thailandensis]|uniref:VapE domain-containing protein n=1 Tax=Burkholderia thailandensis TaxID=57975 RepID=UPI00016A39C1|nr:VapE domain-containing protein [Burkholderia thailandensis]AOI51218.1 virulence protein E [Burkholderia thailandensis]